MTTQPKRGPGRPATGKDPVFPVRLPADTIAALRARAAAQGTSASEIVRTAIERELMRRERAK